MGVTAKDWTQARAAHAGTAASHRKGGATGSVSLYCVALAAPAAACPLPGLCMLACPAASPSAAPATRS